MVHAIPAELDNFVREVLQNARDQRRGEETVKVRFTFMELTGGHKEGFLRAMAWDELEPHIEAATRTGGITIGPQLQRALDMMSEDRLLLCRIEDSGTRGLVGGEDEHGEGANFNLLCRDTLVTAEGADTRIGSFGLGKSVMWRFSVASTVLFSSRIHEGRRSRLRLFGRAELPFHETDGSEWLGQGYFGAEELRQGGRRRAVSAWDDDAEEVARQLHLFRAIQLGDGTSILVVGFFEPSREQPRPAGQIARDVLASATRWFWPSLIGSHPPLRVQVEVLENNREVFSERAEINDEVQPFVLAATETEPVEQLSEAGQVAEQEIPFRIPARKPTETDTGEPQTDAALQVRVRVAGPDESPKWHNHIALFRGAGMVVAYRPCDPSRTEQPYHGVLRGGLAHGSGAPDRALERFMRAAEPPSHNEWKPGTDRLNAEYKQGAGVRLSKLWTDLRTVVLGLFKEPEPDTVEGPRRLAELFPIFGRGSTTGPEKFRVEDVKADLQTRAWKLCGRVRCVAEESRPWMFTLVARLDGETGQGDLLDIRKMEVDHGSPVRVNERWECAVPGDERVVEFTATTSTIPVNDLRRTRIRVDVTGRFTEAS
jgi:hypothetical protein